MIFDTTLCSYCWALGLAPEFQENEGPRFAHENAFVDGLQTPFWGPASPETDLQAWLRPQALGKRK